MFACCIQHCSHICLYRPFDASLDDDCVSKDDHGIPVTMDTIPVLQHSMVNILMVI